jgi:hypothetical protein
MEDTAILVESGVDELKPMQLFEVGENGALIGC